MIYILEVHRQGDLLPTRWYFEYEYQYDRAYRIAETMSNIHIITAHEDYITDAYDFERWAQRK